MTRAAATPDSITPGSITLHVPFHLAKQGGRKAMVLPPDAPAERPCRDDTLIKALARAHRWKRMLDSGDFATLAELAEREKIAPSYLTRVLRLTLLAPDIVEAILDGRQGEGVTLARLLEPFPGEWEGQRATGRRKNTFINGEGGP